MGWPAKHISGHQSNCGQRRVGMRFFFVSRRLMQMRWWIAAHANAIFVAAALLCLQSFLTPVVLFCHRLYSKLSYFPPSPCVHFSIQGIAISPLPLCISLFNAWIFLQALCPHVRSCWAVKLLMLLWFVAQVFTFDKNLSFQRLEQQGLAAKRNPFGITYMGPLRSEESWKIRIFSLWKYFSKLGKVFTKGHQVLSHQPHICIGPSG